MILPLWNGVTELEILNRLVGNEEPVGPQLVRETFAELAKGGDLEAKWSQFLRQGFLPDSAWPEAALNFNAGGAVAAFNDYRPVNSDGLEVAFTPSSTLDDGRYANNGWLQETPDIVTKVTWDNAALLSPATAKSLGTNDGDMIELSAGHRTIEAAVLIAPGHADGVCSISLGYGRKNVTHVSDKVGFNAYPLRTTNGMSFAANASLRRTGAKHKFAETQTHQSMEGRDLVREGTAERYAQYFALHPSNAHLQGAVGDGGRSQHLHGMQRMRRRLPSGKQRADCRQRPSLTRPQHGVDPHGSLLCRRRGRSRNAHAGHHVPALRKCALRNCLPGQCDRAQRGRTQPHGLQPLYRHAVLREQLPVESPPFQFLRL
jgi:molybdopterin-containing oxidoreductase family iron-sulfur binding subunit